MKTILFAYLHLPRRKMMARSYSWTVLRQNQMETGKVTATRIIENTYKTASVLKEEAADGVDYLQHTLPSVRVIL